MHAVSDDLGDRRIVECDVFPDDGRCRKRGNLSDVIRRGYLYDIHTNEIGAAKLA